MRKRSVRLIALAAAAVLALALAACNDDDDDVVVEEPPEPPAEEIEDIDDVDVEASVAVASTDLGDILVDADGYTIYQFDNDVQGAGESACVDDCAEAWPAVVVDDDPTGTADVTAELSTITREDGTTQLTVDGWPAYTFSGDQTPGDVQGQGVADVWWVFAPDGETIRNG